ncbi:MAG: dihydroorotate dehydrogenase [Proteobacteria bacterium]|nr:dihydroorotate dehydrogenase [Pseudomonadota bacterium]
MISPLSRTALRSRWTVQRLARAADELQAAEVGACRRHGDGAAAGRDVPVRVMRLVFASPLILAAGLDRHGYLLRSGAALGLGAVETGSHWTTSAQPLPLHPLAHAGTHVDAGRPLLAAGSGPAALHGLSLAKPPGLDWAEAGTAYWRAVRAWHRSADYVVLNPGRGGPAAAEFADLVAALSARCARLVRARRLALVVKLPATWIEPAGRAALACRFVAAGADGLLVSAEGAAAGVCRRLAELREAVGPAIGLVSVGGIDSVPEARARLRAGANLVQVHRAALRSGPCATDLLARIAALRSQG